MTKMRKMITKNYIHALEDEILNIDNLGFHEIRIDVTDWHIDDINELAEKMWNRTYSVSLLKRDEREQYILRIQWWLCPVESNRFRDAEKEIQEKYDKKLREVREFRIP